MIDVYYTWFKKKLPDNLWEKYIRVLPVEFQEKNSKFVRWQDRHSHLFGRLLLLEGFKKYKLSLDILKEIKYNEYLRPCLDNQIDFNISHSGELVVCAISKQVRVGIDVEEIKNIVFSDFNNVMTPEQWNEIKNAKEPDKMFFRLWTIKESVIKADSRGLSIPLLEIKVNKKCVSYDDNNWYIKEIEFDDKYCACLASNLKISVINIKKIDFYLRKK